MCGIGGFAGRFDPLILSRMNAMMAHRGPDDAGICYYEKSGIGLAHRRLAIIDLSSLGHQPMWDSTTTAAITFNGEIYNYGELKQSLLKEGYRFASNTDTEVLLNLYLAYGSDMFSRINGMFAFAIFDSRDNSLFIARDGAGIKPLYWAQCKKGFLFASEMKAILAESSVSRDLNYDAIRCYVNYLWAPAPWTMLKAVNKLEPGSFLRVRDGTVDQKTKFYDFPYDQAIRWEWGEKQVVEMVREAVDRAVSRQLVSDARLGAFLSGGVDSSAIVGTAVRHTDPSHFKCFTISIPEYGKEGFEDDLPYARETAKFLGVQLDVIEPGPDFLSYLPFMIYHLDEPEADPAGLMVYFISLLAKQQDVKVLLSGSGGDDVFAGYRRHHASSLETYWNWLPIMARRRLGNISQKLVPSVPLFRRLRKTFHFAEASELTRLVGYYIWPDSSWETTIYSRECISQFRQESVHAVLEKSLESIPKGTHRLNKMLYLEAKHFLADHNHNYTDKMSMATGVEVRVPYLDLELLDLVTKIPPNYKLRRGEGKWVLRAAMDSTLPSRVLRRTKTGFGVPVRTWFKRGFPNYFQDIVATETFKSRGLFDPEALGRIASANSRGILDASYVLLAVLCIELWLQMFVDKPVPEVVVLS